MIYKEKKRAYDRTYRQNHPTKSGICKICGIIGGRNFDRCLNESRHESLIKTRLLVSKMKKESYLLKAMETTSVYKHLKKALDEIEEVKGRSIVIKLKRKKRSNCIV